MLTNILHVHCIGMKEFESPRELYILQFCKCILSFQLQKYSLRHIFWGIEKMTFELVYRCSIMRSYFLRCHTMPPPKEMAAHIIPFPFVFLVCLHSVEQTNHSKV